MRISVVPWRRPLSTLLATALVAGLCTACATGAPTVAASHEGVPGTPSLSPTLSITTPPVSTPSRLTTPAPACAMPIAKFDCDMQARIVKVQAYIQTRPGTVGIVLRDRESGAIWSNDYAQTMVWTASTIKLAMVVDLYTRQREGRLALTAQDRTQIQQMLNSSDDEAADALWFRYAGADHLAYNNSFPKYGLTALTPQRGYTNFFPYWGFQECTPADLDRLIQYVLTNLPVTERGYIIDQLQHVAADQQWGIWAAGPALQPGNKDGWSQEASGWVLNSVGFAGAAQRYTLAIMNSLNGHGGYDDGTLTDSTVAKLLLTGR